METKVKEKKEMKSLAECVNYLTMEGFDKQFKAVKDGLKELSSEKIYSPYQVKIVNFYRFEGESDPADNSILYAIETEDGMKGTLTDAFGPYADSKVSEFIKEVEELHKTVNKKEVVK